MKLSEKIFTLRKEKGLSQEELAEKLNVSRQAVSRFVQVPAPSVYWKDGQKWYRWDGMYRTDYKYFIQEYDLKLLVYLFWLMAIAGGLYLIVTHEKVKPYLKKIRGVSNGDPDRTGG